jgi:hypothetical protein
MNPMHQARPYRPTVTMVVMELALAGLVTAIIVMLASYALA